MPDVEHFDLTNIAKELVKGIAHAQRMLDEDAICYMQYWSEAAGQLGIDHAGRSFAEEIIASPLHLSQYSIALEIALTQYHTRDFKILAAVLGTPIHTFYRGRFNASRIAVSRIEVTCNATVGTL